MYLHLARYSTRVYIGAHLPAHQSSPSRRPAFDWNHCLCAWYRRITVGMECRLVGVLSPDGDEVDRLRDALSAASGRPPRDLAIEEVTLEPDFKMLLKPTYRLTRTLREDDDEEGEGPVGDEAWVMIRYRVATGVEAQSLVRDVTMCEMAGPRAVETWSAMGLRVTSRVVKRGAEWCLFSQQVPVTVRAVQVFRPPSGHASAEDGDDTPALPVTIVEAFVVGPFAMRAAADAALAALAQRLTRWVKLERPEMWAVRQGRGPLPEG